MRSLLLLCILLALPASAQAFQLGTDGTTDPIYDYNQAIRQRVFIPQPGIDQDADGVADKVAVEIIRPKESGPGTLMPAIIDPSPYFTTVCRGNEGQCIGDTDGDGLNDKWPLFLGKYFVPRGYAYVLAESDGTANSTGCPLHGGPGDVAGMKSVIDWLNGRVPGYDKNGAAVVANWHNGSSAMIGKSYDGTLTNAVAATGVAGLKAIVPESAISDWYKYSRANGIRFNTHYPASLSNTITDADRRDACKASRDTMSTQDGDDTGDVNSFWDARDYLTDVSKVKAAVLETHGLQDDNVKLDEFAPWWAGLEADGVPRKLWLLREGHVDPFDSRRAVWVDTLHRWFDHWLYGVPNGIMETPRVDIEDSKDTWNTYADWPLPTSRDTDVYLQATTATDAGAVGLSTGGNLDSVSFADVPNQSETTAITTPTGTQAARRVFLSGVLTKPLRLSGTPRITLDASLSLPQSNLGAIVVDYGPSTQITRSGEGIANTTTRTCWGQHPTSAADFSGCYLEVSKPTTAVTQWRVTRGILDSSNRDSLRTPTTATPGAVTSFPWPLLPADYTFATGHQIGIVLVGDYTSYPSVAGTPAATITVGTRTTRVTLPVVGGYAAARQSGAFTPDTIAPDLTVSGDVTTAADDPDGTAVTYTAPAATDNEDPSPTVACDHASGAVYPVGETTVTCTATDLSANTRSKAFKVTVTGQAAATATPTDTATAAPTATTTAAPVATPPPPPSGGDVQPIVTPPPTLDTPGDVIAPTVRVLRVRRGRHGVIVRLKVSERATVTITLLRHGKRPRKIRRQFGRGRHRLTLHGRGYRIVVRAVDAAGNTGRTSHRV